jgi:hypothetical protein
MTLRCTSYASCAEVMHSTCTRPCRLNSWTMSRTRLCLSLIGQSDMVRWQGQPRVARNMWGRVAKQGQ